MATSRKSERLLALTLLLLQTMKPLSRSEIRRLVGDYPKDASDAAFEKMFERDKDELRSIAIPVETVEIDGQEGSGYIINKSEAKLPTIELDPDECVAVGLAARMWTGVANQSDAIHAMRKISSNSAGASSFDTESGLVVRSSEPTLDAELVRQLSNSVEKCEVVTFKYRKPGVLDSEARTVSSWGIVVQQGVWYLAGFDHDRNDSRVFRVARIVGGMASVKADIEYVNPDGVTPEAMAASAYDFGKRSQEMSIRVRRSVLNGDLASTDTELKTAVVKAINGAKASQLQTMSSKLGSEVEAELEKLAKTVKSSSRSSDRANQFSRILALIPWLIANPGVTKLAAAEKFGVSEDQIGEDLELAVCTEFGEHLVTMDINVWGSTLQVYDPQGMGDALRFSYSEAFSLLMGLRLLGELPDIANRDSILSAEAKLQALSFGTVESLKGIQVSQTTAEEGNDFILDADAAIANSEIVELVYRSNLEDQDRIRRIEPLRMSVVQGNRYLVAWCQESEGIRHFRFDRISSLKRTGESFDSDPRRELSSDSEVVPTDNRAVVLVSEEAAWWPDTLPSSIALPIASGGLVVSVPLASDEWLAREVLSFGGSISVIEPISVAQLVIDRADQLIATNV